MREFLIALALYCRHYWNGMGDDLYRIGGLASRYLLKWYQIRDPEDWIMSPAICIDNQLQADKYYLDLVRKYEGEKPTSNLGILAAVSHASATRNSYLCSTCHYDGECDGLGVGETTCERYIRVCGGGLDD